MILDTATQIVRKGALAYVGAVALAGDTVGKRFDQYAKRGATVEHDARERLGQARSDMRKRFEHATQRLLQNVKAPINAGEEQAGAVGNMLEQSRDRVLDALNIPNQRTLHELNTQIDHLGAAIDDLRTQMRRAKAEAEPLPGYDKMNVDTVLGHLASLDTPGLRKLHAYEQAHGKRVTVLRAVEERLAPKAEG